VVIIIFAYLRISTQKETQTTDRQRLTLEQYATYYGFEFNEVVEERISGTIQAEHRPKYLDLKTKLRKDDILIVTDVDRLGRNADDVIMEFKRLKANGIRVIALDTPYLCEWDKVQDSSIYNMIADIFITLKAHIAQQEREKAVSRINQGLMVARKNNKQLGRPKAQLPSNFVKEYKKFKDGTYGNISAAAFARTLGIGRSTLYKYINIYNKNSMV
jgi:DNA invertase Pin-like site-specific DNA recombinase